jgi:hypothetical protein
MSKILIIKSDKEIQEKEIRTQYLWNLLKNEVAMKI